MTASPAIERICLPRVVPVAPDDAASLLVGPAEPDTIRRGLAPPHRGFLEADADDDGLSGLGPRGLAAVRSGGLALSLRTASAFRLDCPGLLVEALLSRFGLPGGEPIQLIGICLAEAIGNAIIHGNLGIPDHLRGTSNGFDHFRQLLRSRVEDPALGGRRLVITAEQGTGGLIVAVGDQGLGFDLTSRMQRGARNRALCGRGLGLIRRLTADVWAEEDGRTLLMRFAP